MEKKTFSIQLLEMIKEQMKISTKLLLVRRLLQIWLSTRLSLIQENCKLKAIDLIKQKTLDADQKATQEITLTGNLSPAGNTAMFFIPEKVKETILVSQKDKSIMNVFHQFI